eukprot:6431185-Alexandrium_andersonii.AAC.1
MTPRPEPADADAAASGPPRRSPSAKKMARSFRAKDDQDPERGALGAVAEGPKMSSLSSQRRRGRDKHGAPAPAHEE